MVRRRRAAPVVVDASIVVKWLARESDSESASRLIAESGLLLAPDLLPIEVANVLWKKIRRGDMPAADLQPAIANLMALGVELQRSAPILGQAAQLALEIDHPVYDCLYLTVASEAGASLATADRRLRQAAASIGLVLWA